MSGVTSPAFGADAPLEELVVTASRSEQRLSEVSSNIQFLTQDTLSLVGHTHINEAMQQIAGAWISRGNGQEHLTAIRSPVLTGAGACGAFLMAQDGIPLRATGFCNVNELFDANTEQAGRIEVIKGPAGVLYGSGAMHGMINVITPKIESGGSVIVEGGPHDYRRAKVSANSERWRVDANGTSDGGFKTDSGFDQQKLTVRNRTDLGEWQAVTVFSGANLNQETAGFIVGPEVYKDEGLRRSNPNPEAYRDVWSARLYSRLSRVTQAGHKVVITPYFRATGMDFLQHFLPGQALEENRHRSIGVQSAWYGGPWTLGLDTEVTNGGLLETQPDPTAGSPFLQATIPPGKHYDYEIDARTLAAFAQYRLPLSDRADLTVGVRAEQIRYDYDNLMRDGRTRDNGEPCGFGGCRFNRPADRSDTFTNFSPAIGISYLLTEASQAYIFASQGYRAPQTTELYRLQNGQDISTIDSESLTSIEFGLRGGSNGFGYDVSAYALKKDNFIFRDTERRNVDNGETSHRGVELSLTGNVTSTVSAALRWSYALHRYENTPTLASAPIDGNEIDTAPRSMGSATMTWRPTEALLASAEWVHLGEYYQDPENEQTYPGHDLINLRLRYRVSKSLATFVRITNVGDKDYAERADFAFGSDRYFVGEPRSIYLGVELRLN